MSGPNIYLRLIIRPDASVRSQQLSRTGDNSLDDMSSTSTSAPINEPSSDQDSTIINLQPTILRRLNSVAKTLNGNKSSGKEQLELHSNRSNDTKSVDLFQILENFIVETLFSSSPDLSRPQLLQFILTLEDYLKLKPADLIVCREATRLWTIICRTYEILRHPPDRFGKV